jgi:hypothetical protein
VLLAASLFENNSVVWNASFPSAVMCGGGACLEWSEPSPSTVNITVLNCSFVGNNVTRFEFPTMSGGTWFPNVHVVAVLTRRRPCRSQCTSWRGVYNGAFCFEQVQWPKEGAWQSTLPARPGCLLTALRSRTISLPQVRCRIRHHELHHCLPW